MTINTVVVGILLMDMVSTMGGHKILCIPPTEQENPFELPKPIPQEDDRYLKYRYEVEPIDLLDDEESYDNFITAIENAVPVDEISYKPYIQLQ